MTDTQQLVDQLLWGRNAVVIQDLYPCYQKLREHASCLKTSYGIWAVTRYEAVKDILLSPDFNRQKLYAYQKNTDAALRPIETLRKNSLPFMSGEQHKLIKKMTLQVINQAMTTDFAAKVAESSGYLLRSIQKKRAFDLIKDYAHPLSTLIIGEALNIPRTHWPLLCHWASNMYDTLEPRPSQTQRKRLDTFALKFYDYFADIDVGNPFFNLTLDKTKLSKSQLIYATIFLFLASQETLTNFIGLSMLALIDNPNQWQLWQHDKQLTPKALEELLRFDSPIQVIFKVASKNTTVNRYNIQQGETVALLIGSANRDPRQFTQPDQLHITRDPNPHLAFGLGAHTCVGTKLTRWVASIALRDLINLLPLKRILPTLQYKTVMITRGLKQLKLTQR